jgi:hypothetical protein
MSIVLPYAVCLVDLFTVAALGLGLRQMKEYRTQIKITPRQFQRIVVVLIGASLFVIVVLAAVLAAIVPGEILARFSHAILMLGLWTVITPLALVLIVPLSLGRVLPVSSAAGLLVAMASVGYLTPFDRFQALFAAASDLLPLITGLVMSGACYVLLWHVYRMLRSAADS